MKRLLSVMFVSIGLISCSVMPQDRVTLKVASAQVDCIGIVPQKCLLVQPVTDQTAVMNGDWAFFYSEIEGFDYRPGFEYTLLIDQVPQKKVAADQSSIVYRLVKVIDATETVSVNMPQTLSMTKN